VNVPHFGCALFLLALFSMSSFILSTLAEARALTNPIRDEMTKLSLCTSAQHFITGCQYTVILYSCHNSAVTPKLLKNTTVSVPLVPLCGGLQQDFFPTQQHICLTDN
jgi:hypothetical protein